MSQRYNRANVSTSERQFSCVQGNVFLEGRVETVFAFRS